MARVFLSHSSRDNAAAAWMKQWLETQGFDVPFLDFDKHAGIPPGADWEQTLYRELTTCQAILILQTPNWEASRWCFAEYIQARALGKPILQVIESQEAGGLLPVASDLQRLDLGQNREQGLEQLRRVLEELALFRQGGFAWDPRRPPFPGLMAFEAEDAAVYFGRDKEIAALAERLTMVRTYGGPSLLVLLGDSGSGKSRFLPEAMSLADVSQLNSYPAFYPCGTCPAVISRRRIRAPRFFRPKNQPRDQFVAVFDRFVAFFAIFIGTGLGGGGVPLEHHCFRSPVPTLTGPREGRHAAPRHQIQPTK
jgi:hypothetical protein